MDNTIPGVDLSPFFREQEDIIGMTKAKTTIDFACRTYGFFRIVNHGMPKSLMRRAIDHSKDLFGQNYEEKMKFGPDHRLGSPLPTGYMRQPEISGNKNEYLLMFKPELEFNVYPNEPIEFRSTLEECFTQLSKTALLVERILNECMGLPPNSIKNYDDEDGNTALMLALRYFSTTRGDDQINALAEHQDGSCISLVFQDEVGGLEVLKDGQWISVDPEEGSIIVNIGDIVQVLTNNTFKSATHRVTRRDRDRYSYAFFLNADKEKWIEPLPQFTSDICVPPKYGGFWYKDYLQLRMKNISLPREEFFDISKYALSA